MGLKKKKNDNLARHRMETVRRNEELVRRAVAHIREIGGEPTFSLVSRVTRDLANPENGEKGLTAAALSKNPLYREIILASAEAESMKKGQSSSTARLTGGDARMAMHTLRVENAKLRRENAILADRLSKRPEPERIASPVPQKLVDELSLVRRSARSLMERLMELELAALDESGNLVLPLYGEIIARREALRSIFGEGRKDENGGWVNDGKDR